MTDVAPADSAKIRRLVNGCYDNVELMQPAIFSFVLSVIVAVLLVFKKWIEIVLLNIIQGCLHAIIILAGCRVNSGMWHCVSEKNMTVDFLS